MLEINLNPFPVLRTERLRLREIVKNDAEEILFLRSDEQVLEFLDRAPATSVDEAIQWIEGINDSTKKNEVVTWAIQLEKETKLIGTITFWNIKKDHYRAEIGYALYPAHQGKGLMQEAMVRVLDYGFRTLKLHSVEANVHPGNISSILLLERNNFSREGYLKENYYYAGKFSDTVIYSLITPYKTI